GAGPQLPSTFFTVSTSTPRRSVNGLRLGASDTIAPTLRSRLAHPSSRLPIPGANELSTVEWQNAHWIPIDLTLPSGFVKAVTPTTAFNLRRARVVAGSSRLTFPAASCFFKLSGSASASTLRPTDNAVFGETPGPRPPFFSPAMALCNWSASPQKASLPNVSKRKIFLPSWIWFCAWRRFSTSTLWRDGAAAKAMIEPDAAAPLIPAAITTVRSFIGTSHSWSSRSAHLLPQCRQARLRPGFDLRMYIGRGPDQKVPASRQTRFGGGVKGPNRVVPVLCSSSARSASRRTERRLSESGRCVFPVHRAAGDAHDAIAS